MNLYRLDINYGIVYKPGQDYIDLGDMLKLKRRKAIILASDNSKQWRTCASVGRAIEKYKKQVDWKR